MSKGTALLKYIVRENLVDNPNRIKAAEKVLSEKTSETDADAVLARAHAFMILGAEHRRDALACMEQYFNLGTLDIRDASGLYTLAGQLYEKEYNFEQAERYYKMQERAWERHPNFKAFGRQPNVLLGRLYLKMDVLLAVRYWESQTLSPEYVSGDPNASGFRRSVDHELKNAREKQAKGYKYKPRRR